MVKKLRLVGKEFSQQPTNLEGKTWYLVEDGKRVSTYIGWQGGLIKDEPISEGVEKTVSKTLPTYEVRRIGDHIYTIGGKSLLYAGVVGEKGSFKQILERVDILNDYGILDDFERDGLRKSLTTYRSDSLVKEERMGDLSVNPLDSVFSLDAVKKARESMEKPIVLLSA